MSRGTTDVFMSRNGKRVLVLFFAGFLIFLYLPTILLTIFSFNASTVIGFPLSGFTTDFYEAAWQNPEIKGSLFASLKVAAGTAVVATALARPRLVRPCPEVSPLQGRRIGTAPPPARRADRRPRGLPPGSLPAL